MFEIDGQTKGNRHELIQRFAPYYNDFSSSEIDNEIRILIATDILAEDLNLQDASCLISYGLCVLTELGRYIWNLLPQAEEPEDTLNAVLRDYDISGEIARADITEFLENLKTMVIL